MAGSLKNALDRGIASVTVKSSTFLETSKYSNQIHIAEDSIAKLKSSLGAMLYDAWKSGQPLNDLINNTFQEITNYEEQIAQLNQKIEDIKNESRQVLGKAPVAAAPAGTVQYCASCGAENKLTAKFCYKCGDKMQEL